MSNANEETAAGKMTLGQQIAQQYRNSALLADAIDKLIAIEVNAALSGKAAADARVAELEAALRSWVEWFEKRLADEGSGPLADAMMSVHGKRMTASYAALSPTPPRQI